jgi:hypothetical protein
MHDQGERPEWGSSQAWNEAMKNVFARCFKKMAVQVCTVIINYYAQYLVMSCILIICCNFLPSGNLIRDTDWFLFFAGEK